MFKRFLFVACMLSLLVRTSSAEENSIVGDSLVLAGQSPGKLLVGDVVAESVVVRSTYVPGGTTYELGKDYQLDAKAGTISRMLGSRIPDFATNMLYGKKDFDHSKFPGYGNGKFFVYVDYRARQALKLTEPRDASKLLAQTVEKLRSGKPMKVVAFGDSITAGGEASTVALQYPSRYVEHLRGLFPGAQITLENGATGGDSTVQGLARLDEKVIRRTPDLVLVAFGMNDHNIPGFGVEVAAFKQNLKQIVATIRQKTGADVILLSSFPPNPEWHFSSHRMEDYARATEEAAAESEVAYADVYGLWKTVLERKDFPSLLGNNINHPNDFGHWLYVEALSALSLR
jgi:lysophospholipase L1-like esterase